MPAILPENQTKPGTQTVVVGMSGGVDSSVSALLLKQQGYRVIGLFMKNWEELDESGQCTSARDFEDVSITCARLNIPCQSVNFAKEYQEKVFADFLRDYRQGYTPNPDVLCNREIKFNVFLKYAMNLGADYLATGHYCRIIDGQLCRGLDQSKDQSYFLNSIDRSVLKQVLFPIGHLRKTEVRKIAREACLPVHNKKDSTGICFIGERHFTKFLSTYIQAQPGEFRLLDETVVGQHRGAAYYTLGQRRQLGLGGPGEPWFVVAKDMATNVVYVERGQDHPALYCKELYAEDLVWSGPPPDLTKPFRCHAKIRYRQPDQACTILPHNSQGMIRVVFDEPQRAVNPRQFIAFYDETICLGGACITDMQRGELLAAKAAATEPQQKFQVSRDNGPTP